MKKLSPKQEKVEVQMVIILSQLLIESFDNLGWDENDTSMYPEILAVKNRCLKLNEKVYDIDKLRNTTYIGEINKKVRTVIRKNFKDIDE